MFDFSALETINRKVRKLMATKLNGSRHATLMEHPAVAQANLRAQATLEALQANPRIYGDHIEERPDSSSASRKEKQRYVRESAPLVAAAGLSTAVDGVELYAADLV